MAQPHKGERAVTTFRTVPDLKTRMVDESKAAGSPDLTAYLVELLSALHPDPELHPEAAKAAKPVVKALLAAARDMRAEDLRAARNQLELPSLSKDHAAA
ncbi:hypothetical protein FHR32_001368 [Streptosporangium album]|uniref:Uncharacterized protein n=1 Tax=Streptosporangium album TaxID=47479 RepID=A0A7W7W7P2_9ACTN|nr:hypothetical protein [Streptosporangium album]MBB4937063.1 hypothetical protein [Streptosporangium album]